MPRGCGRGRGPPLGGSSGVPFPSWLDAAASTTSVGCSRPCERGGQRTRSTSRMRLGPPPQQQSGACAAGGPRLRTQLLTTSTPRRLRQRPHLMRRAPTSTNRPSSMSPRSCPPAPLRRRDGRSVAVHVNLFRRNGPRRLSDGRVRPIGLTTIEDEPPGPWCSATLLGILES
jgi:hypothetical protein